MTCKALLAAFAFALVAITALAADDAPGVVVWKAGALRGYAKKMSTELDELKYASEPLADYGNYVTSMSHREGNGDAEVHEKITDVIVIQSGQATLLLGGKLVDPKTVRPGELRAASGEGGVRHDIGPGDIVNIPANVLHQFFVAPGKQITYFVIKVQSK